jgi:hypothetical protein
MPLSPAVFVHPCQVIRQTERQLLDLDAHWLTAQIPQRVIHAARELFVPLDRALNDRARRHRCNRDVGQNVCRFIGDSKTVITPSATNETSARGPMLGPPCTSGKVKRRIIVGCDYPWASTMLAAGQSNSRTICPYDIGAVAIVAVAHHLGLRGHSTLRIVPDDRRRRKATSCSGLSGPANTMRTR